ncbi:hypothetical protein SDC9_153680 [bioreactor metagenome]|uniref:Uncharacterized protein n=1 Tax=bioreactor metagenome TaxID=1076179 RepID=A0A645F1C5_9ZZZZ
MAGAGVAAAAVDLFHHHRGFGQTQAGAAVFLRNHHRQPAGPGQRVDTRLGVGTGVVYLAKILIGEAFEEIAQCLAQLGMAFLVRHVQSLEIQPGSAGWSAHILQRNLLKSGLRFSRKALAPSCCSPVLK